MSTILNEHEAAIASPSHVSLPRSVVDAAIATLDADGDEHGVAQRLREALRMSAGSDRGAAQLVVDAARALSAWDSTVLRRGADGRLQEAMECLRQWVPAGTEVPTLRGEGDGRSATRPPSTDAASPRQLRAQIRDKGAELIHLIGYARSQHREDPTAAYLLQTSLSTVQRGLDFAATALGETKEAE